MEGVVLGGNVRLETCIGRGGAGEVWRATHLGLGRPVAVKLLSGPQATVDLGARARFVREAQLIARLDHPHVVKVFDVNNSPEGSLYVVLELLEGVDLKSRVEDGALAVAETLSIVDQTAQALEAAHALGIIHRDVKPANIFLVGGDARRVKVLDFGIAKASDAGVDRHLTMTGVMMGSPYYMSPEQFVDPRRVDQRTDLWSLAVTAYACLTGALPFLGESVGALAVAVNAGSFTSARQLVPSLPPAVDGWFAKALAVSPDARFSSARELSSTLREALLSSGPAPSTSAAPSPAQPTLVTSTPPGFAASAPAVSRHRPWVIAAAAVALGVGATTALALSHARGDRTDATARDDPSPRKSARAPAVVTDTAESTSNAPLLAPSAALQVSSVAPSASAQLAPIPNPAEPTPTVTSATPPTATALSTNTQPVPTASTASTPAKPACNCPDWQPRKMSCAKQHGSKSCSACCKPGDRLAPYPSCECLLDRCALPGSACSK